MVGLGTDSISCAGVIQLVWYKVVVILLYGWRIILTSEERREARYQRRKQKRKANKEKRNAQLGPIDKVFGYALETVNPKL